MEEEEEKLCKSNVKIRKYYCKRAPEISGTRNFDRVG